MSEEKPPSLRRKFEKAFETTIGVATAIVYTRVGTSPAKGFKEGNKAARAFLDKMYNRLAPDEEKEKPEKADRKPPASKS
jgi:hypothetical protein